MSSGPFRRLRVLEFGHFVAGPLVGQLLADQGADVLKVEPPGGERYRREPRRFIAWNRGKRSIVLDLSDAVDRDRFIGLASGADVVIDNHRPGVRESLGIDFAALRSSNPGLITVSISGFGRRGPLRDVPGWEPLVHGRAGVHVGFGEPTERVWRPFPLASVAAGLLATLGVVAALLERDRTGLGQDVETSLLAAALYINGSSILQGDVGPMPIQSRSQFAAAHIYSTADGWLQVVAGTARSGVAFRQLLSDEAGRLGETPTAAPGDADLAPPLAAAQAVLATRTAEHWEQRLAAIGVPAGMCRPVQAWLAHPQAQANGLAVSWPDTAWGEVAALGPPIPPVAADAGTAADAGPPPALGTAGATWCDDDRFGPDRSDIAAPDRPAPVLDGVTVIDLTRILPGPLTGRVLAELGATVIKVEPPGGEEGYRAMTGGVPFMYVEGNRSKQSVELDLQDEEGREQFRRLVRHADVVVENARAGVWDALGIGEADLRQVNPALVYARTKGYGVEGPSAGLRAFEHVLQAVTGIQITQGGSGPPRMMTVPACDYAAPLYLAIGVLTGLLTGRRSGAWPTVTASLASAASVYQAEHLVRIDGEPSTPDDVGPDLRGPDAARRIYQAADGWVTVFAPSAAQQAALCDVVGVGSPDALEEAFRSLHVEPVVAALSAAGVPAAPSVLPQDVARDPQVIDGGLLTTLEHPTLGRLVQVDIPFSLSLTPPRIQGPAPLLPPAT
jgi:crotonobetainyl-CoA:carnitine CoA-transferase CaiB-like acyl-CoA transferase